MSILESRTVRFTPKCDECGWRGLPERTKERAQKLLDRHPHAEHRPEWGSGSHRGILGGTWDTCICGAGWANVEGTEWACPREASSCCG